jgi:hypothetical protein
VLLPVSGWTQSAEPVTAQTAASQPQPAASQQNPGTQQQKKTPAGSEQKQPPEEQQPPRVEFEVLVTAPRMDIPLKENPWATSVVSEKTLESMPRSVGAEEALQLTPGLKVDNQADGERVHLSIRGQGLLTERGIRGIAVLLDGIPLNDPSGSAAIAWRTGRSRPSTATWAPAGATVSKPRSATTQTRTSRCEPPTRTRTSCTRTYRTGSRRQLVPARNHTRGFPRCAILVWQID